VDAARFDLWRYASLLEPEVPPAHRLSLGEGWTPALASPALAARLGLERLVLKREDLNPLGSHKARGTCFQVARERSRQAPGSWLVLSSSGNAALAAAAYTAAAGLRLAAFLAPATPPAKVRDIARLGATVFLATGPLGLAEALADERGLANLRPSTHPDGVTGYQTLGWELLETVPALEALFMFASSGSGLVGVARAFERADEVTAEPWRPRLQVVQGCGVHPLAGPLDPRPPPEPGGRLGARGARKTRRLGELLRAVRASGGAGWVISDAEAEAAAALLAEHGILTSLEGSAALAAAARAAREAGIRTAGVVLTGSHHGATETVPQADLAKAAASAQGSVHAVESLSEVLAVLEAGEAGVGAASLRRGRR
jgi:threonine synthase